MHYKLYTEGPDWYRRAFRRSVNKAKCAERGMSRDNVYTFVDTV